jgi:DNA-binding MarR family transcriptional regulator
MPSPHGRAAPAPRPQPSEGSFRQLLRTLGLLERVMQPYFARFGITGAQWGVLCNLHRAEREGHPALRLTDLSERLLIRPPSVSSVVDRLERAKLVSRGDSTTDLRTKPVVLTERGRGLVERILAVHGAQIEALMGALTSSEQSELQGLLRRLEEHMAVLLADGGLLNGEV